MAERIIILTGKREAPYLADFVSARAPHCAVLIATTQAEFAGAMRGNVRATRLIAFCTGVIVERDMLERLGLQPYNVHPGSPDYPGLYPEAFALADGAIKFGATAHVITPEIDAGAIVAVEEFKVPPGIDRLDLADLAYRAALALFAEIVGFCAISDAAIEPTGNNWRGKAKRRREYEEICTAHPWLRVDVELDEKALHRSAKAL